MRAPTDRAAVPEASSRRGPILPILFLTTIICGLLYLVPTLESLAGAYRTHALEMAKSRRCEDTTKPVTRRAAKL